ncbi:MAG: hypothetical protein ACFKPT_26825 [Gloeotrichia echinulata GP01]
MNSLFLILASCVLAVIVAFGDVASPALAQSSGEVQVICNLPTTLSKNSSYYIKQSSEGSTIVKFQNHSVDQEAEVALLYKDISNIVQLTPNNIKGVTKQYEFGGSRVTVQNISNLDPEVKFLVVSQGSSNCPKTVDDNFNIATDANTPVDKIVDQVKYSQKFVIQIVNNTPYTLSREGAYNNSSNWPIGDIGPSRVVGQQFSGNSFTDSFSFASNYKIGDTGKFVQFSASWPFVGSRKINIGVINESLTPPAKKAWDKMYDSNDKFAKNDPFNVRAFMTQKNGSIIWSYQVQ